MKKGNVFNVAIVVVGVFCWTLFLFQMVNILIPMSINAIQLIWILTFFIPKKNILYQVKVTVPHKTGSGYYMRGCTLNVLGGINENNFMSYQDDIRENYNYDKDVDCFIEFSRL